MRRTLLFLLALLILTTPGGAWAAPASKLVVYLVGGVSFSDLLPGGPLEGLRKLGDNGAIALLDSTVQRETTEAAVYLTMGAGTPMAVPGKTGPRFFESGIERTATDLATDAFRADTREGEVVCRTYRRRFGEYPPLRSRIIHIGVPGLYRLQNDSRCAGQIGALGDVLRRAGKHVATYGGWQAVLVGMDKRAAAYDGFLRDPLPWERVQALRSCDVLIDYEDRPRQALALTPTLIRWAKTGKATVVVICLPRLLAEDTTKGLVFALGPSFPPNSRLSAGTPGLIAASEVAPFLARLAGAPWTASQPARITAVHSNGKAWEQLEGKRNQDNLLRQWAPYFLVGLFLLVALIVVGLLLRVYRIRHH